MDVATLGAVGWLLASSSPERKMTSAATTAAKKKRLGAGMLKPRKPSGLFPTNSYPSWEAALCLCLVLSAASVCYTLAVSEDGW